MPVYAVQHKRSYKLFQATDENVDQVANSIIKDASNPFFAIDNDRNHKMYKNTNNKPRKKNLSLSNAIQLCIDKDNDPNAIYGSL